MFDLMRGLDMLNQPSQTAFDSFSLSAYSNPMIQPMAPPPIVNLPLAPPDDPSPLFTLSLDALIRPQLEIYFQRIYPMLPVYTRYYVFDRLDDHANLRKPDFLAVILVMAALSLVHPLYGMEMMDRQTRIKQCRTLMDEACRLMARWNHGSDTSLDAVFATYLIFGILIELGHADASRLRLNETMQLALGMGLQDPSTYTGIPLAEAEARRRMFWVCGISERLITSPTSS